VQAFERVMGTKVIVFILRKQLLRLLGLLFLIPAQVLVMGTKVIVFISRRELLCLLGLLLLIPAQVLKSNGNYQLPITKKNFCADA
jgi:hypothetical protein